MNPQPQQCRQVLAASGGSLVVCLATPSAVYLSADSRYAHAPLSLRDSARKLIACGSTALCGLSGLLRFTRTEGDRYGSHFPRRIFFELSQVVEGLDFQHADGHEPHLADWFAERLFLALGPIWERFAMNLDEPFGYGAKVQSMTTRPSGLAELFYANREASGRVFLASMHLRHSLRRSNSGRYDSVLEVPRFRRLLFSNLTRPRLFVRGARRCVRTEPVSGSINTDLEAIEVLEGVFERAQRVTQCGAAIGGPVDVAVIDADGRRWLKQKPLYHIAVAGNHEMPGL